MRAFGGALFVSLLASAACSDDPPKGGKTNNGGDAGEGGGGSGGSSGGKTSAGSSGRAGNGQTAGDAGSGAQSSAGEGGTGPQCPGCPSGFCLDDGTCVDCLPSDDQCEQGTYCSENNECVPGCKDDAFSCASGKCDENRNCEQCISDSECIGQGDEVVCNEGTCGPACTAGQEGQKAGCADGLTCCSLHCIAVETNSNHCGACGVTCGADQFCGNTDCVGGGEGGAGGGSGEAAACVKCYDTTLSSLCAIGQVVVVYDTNANDNDGNRKPGKEIGDAIGSTCPSAPTVTVAEQDSSEALNFTTGRPVSGGGELLLVAGGNFYQNLVSYVEEAKISPLYLVVDTDNDAQEFRKQSDGSLVVDRMISADNASHDYFIVQFMRDAASGSLVLNIQGFWLSGTTAASFYLQNEVLPNLTDYTKAWYAYEWTDSPDGDKLPSLDEIELVDSGP